MLRAFSMLVADVSNAALYHTLILAALLLLRPVTVRLLTPQQRVVLWGVGLIPGPLLRLTWLKLLPVTFRDLIIPRTAEWMDLPIPAYLPEYQGAGEYLAVLPGGGTVSLELTDAALGVFGAVWLAGMYLLLRYMAQKGRELLSPALKGRLLCGENSPLLEVVPAGWREQVVVCTAEGFPTSFVESVGLIKGYKVGYVICLQQELSPERQRLVLTHEMGHIMLGHCIIKGLLTVMEPRRLDDLSGGMPGSGAGLRPADPAGPLSRGAAGVSQNTGGDGQRAADVGGPSVLRGERHRGAGEGGVGVEKVGHAPVRGLLPAGSLPLPFLPGRACGPGPARGDGGQLAGGAA